MKRDYQGRRERELVAAQDGCSNLLTKISFLGMPSSNRLDVPFPFTIVADISISLTASDHEQADQKAVCSAVFI